MVEKNVWLFHDIPCIHFRYLKVFVFAGPFKHELHTYIANKIINVCKYMHTQIVRLFKNFSVRSNCMLVLYA